MNAQKPSHRGYMIKSSMYYNKEQCCVGCVKNKELEYKVEYKTATVYLFENVKAFDYLMQK